MARQTARYGFISFALFSLMGLPALAQTSDERSSSAPRRGTAVNLLLGIEFGPVFSNATRDDEANKAGYGLGGRAFLNIFTDAVSLDGGAGWVESRITGKVKNTRTNESLEETVRTRNGYAEVAGRYRLTQKFELGLMGRVTFGVDTTLSASDESVTTPNVFAGPQIIYNFTSSQSFVSRGGAFILTDVTIGNRQVYWMGLNFDLGMPLTRGEVIVKKETQIKYKERNRYIIDAEVVNFVTDSSDLPDGGRRYLETLGQFLVKNPTVWERLVISGHTDQRGSDEYNEALAKRRADAVRSVLVAQGVPENRLVVRHLGKRDLIETTDADVALARNRRVELYFVGKINVSALRQGLIKVKQVAHTPETCVDDMCE